MPALVLAGGLAGCGGMHTPKLSALPLPPQSSIVEQAKQCDRGANSYCALELVVVDRRYSSSHQLVIAERDRLRAQGWRGASPDTGTQVADQSPGDKLRVTYATAEDDLQGIEQRWIHRAHAIELALSQTIFNRVPAMSVMLEVGPG